MKAAPGTEQLSVIIALMIWGNNNQLNQLKNFKIKIIYIHLHHQNVVVI